MVTYENICPSEENYVEPKVHTKKKSNAIIKLTNEIIEPKMEHYCLDSTNTITITTTKT